MDRLTTPAPGNDANQIQGWYNQYLGRGATDAEIQSHLGNPGGLSEVMRLIANSPEADAYNKRNKTGDYAPGAPPPVPGAPVPTPQPGAPPSNIFTGYYPGTQLQQDPRFSDLVNTLLDRSKKSLDIDPTTDSVIRPQVDNYAAQQERQRRTYLNEMAESNSPYATGSMDHARTQTSEQAGINTANLQSSLMTNELSARRNEIQNALSEAGSLLTGQQQMQLQHELGLLDAQLKQQGIQSQNDQFFADLGFRSQDRGNYWDAIRSGLIK
jgi:hypothetical protein